MGQASSQLERDELDELDEWDDDELRSHEKIEVRVAGGSLEMTAHGHDKQQQQLHSLPSPTASPEPSPTSDGGGSGKLMPHQRTPDQARNTQSLSPLSTSTPASPSMFPTRLRSSSKVPPPLSSLTLTLVNALRRLPMLSKLSREELVTLSNSMVARNFRNGYRMLLEGDVGSCCFLLVKGRARVSKWHPDQKAEVDLAILQSGDYFGEAALAAQGPAFRGATVTAVGPCLCYLLDADAVRGKIGRETLSQQIKKRAAVTSEGRTAPVTLTMSPRPGVMSGSPQSQSQPQPLTMASSRARAAVSAGGAGVDGAPESTGSSAPANAIRTKDGETTDMLLKVVQDCVLFANLDDAQRKAVVEIMWRQKVNKGEVIIHQGDLGEHWYVVDSGTFDILVVPQTGGLPAKVGTCERGKAVGELALLYNAPRAATIKATTPGAVWVLDRWTFRHVLIKAAQEKRARNEAFLKGVKVFDVLDDDERTRLAEALDEVSYEAGSHIVREGEMGDTFYIILSGLVSVSKKDEGELIQLKSGDYFGERSVIKNEPRAATCLALTKVSCLSLRSDVFKALLGSMDDIFKNRQKEYNQMKGTGQVPTVVEPLPTMSLPNATIKEEDEEGGGDGAEDNDEKEEEKHPVEQEAKKEDPEDASLTVTIAPMRPQHRRQRSNSSLLGGNGGPDPLLLPRIQLSDLRVLGTLGKGSFGVVQLVKDKNGHTYALKIVSKQAVVDLGQQEHVINEKKTMMQLNHPFLVRLYATFQDADRLYFLAEAALGGELFTLLRSRSTFPEQTARFYSAGVILAFEYMHAKGIIYRDLKPENLLLDSKGYLKVTDFGFAKKIGDGRTWTLCGTPDYLAPEVVSGQGHGKGVDWWTLGILIFEMLAGYPPFYDEDPMKTYGRIMSGQITFPMHFSKTAIDLIKKLLNPKASKRYGCLAGGAALIKNHAWFARFDWRAFLSRRLPAPVVLPVKSPEDMSNFKHAGQLSTNIKVAKYRPKANAPRWEKDF